MDLTAGGRGAGEELGTPMADDRARLGKLHISACPDHDDQGGHHRNRSRRMQRNAERAMIGVALNQMGVRHLHSGQQHQQSQTQQSGGAKSAWLPAVAPAIIRLQCGQINHPLLKGYRVLDAAA